MSAAAAAPISRPDARLKRARLAVTLLFLANGAAYSNAVPRLPEIKDSLGLSNSALGTAIAAAPLGALLAGLLAGRLATRFGSGRISVAAGVGQAAVLPLLGVAPGWAGFAAAMFCLGVVDSWMDAAMNTHGLRVQRRYGRSILNAFHGVWSIGAVTGGLVGAAAAQAEVPLRWHLLAAGVVLAAISLSCLPMLLPGPEDAERSHLEEPAEQEHAQESAPAQAQQQPAEQPRPAPSRAAPAHPMRRLLVLGALLLVACAVEDTPASWGAVLLRDSYHAPAAVAGLAFVCFQGAMTVGRLLGDRVTDRFGHVAVARAGGLLIALPMAAALPSGVPALVIAAFLLAGLGTATLYPSVMHASGNLPGIRSETGIAVTTWFARVGFLAMPPLVGLLADRVDLRIGVGVMVLLGVLVVLQAGCLTPRADRKAVAKEQAEQIG